MLFCKSTGTCLAPTRVCKQPNGQETVLKENCWISFPCSSGSVRRSCAVITEGENWSCTVNLLLHVWRPYACNGPPSGLETVLSETCWLSFSTTFFDILMEWTRIVCLLSRVPVFLKIKNKKKSRSGRKIGAVGDDKQLIFFTRPYCDEINHSSRESVRERERERERDRERERERDGEGERERERERERESEREINSQRLANTSDINLISWSGVYQYATSKVITCRTERLAMQRCVQLTFGSCLLIGDAPRSRAFFGGRRSRALTLVSMASSTCMVHEWIRPWDPGSLE